MKKLRIGLVGCGGIANGKHMPSLAKVKGVKLVAFCDLLEERARAAAKAYGAPDAGTYTDYREMLKHPGLQVVHVLTPNSSHSEISCAATSARRVTRVAARLPWPRAARATACSTCGAFSSACTWPMCGRSHNEA